MFPHHPQDSIQGEGDVGYGGIAEIHCRPEGLQVKHSLHGLMSGTAVAFFTGQFTVT